MDFITVGFCDDGWLKVKVVAATENYFEINVSPNGLDQSLRTICSVIPRIHRLDGDFMEAFDGGKDRISNVDLAVVKRFAKAFEFRNVECALPGFDEL
ncbi:hypothetical protein NIES4075_44320 [Tolypothrix sp. NIES-4075]|uniref:hypothetical protein n=1 Tax=Tolypothrix sp. NIES-4075 TaxID=2005459 RepID=UPI000B5CDF92|nr:hypothetical protein [Tolypothrix sp. NIES-4075]GAX43419.1 hypothetical protein NIES4075_44320 [Tolypothrix sp. NIES-4075]